MTAGPRSSKLAERRKQLRISYVETRGDEEWKELRPSISPVSRKGRVHPASSELTKHGKHAMSTLDHVDRKNGRSSNKWLTVDTNLSEERRQQSSTAKSQAHLRSSSDLRSPGGPKTPIAQAAKHPSEGQTLPDFITQTDANGNAVTPRSANAIEGARKARVSGTDSRVQINRIRKPNGDDDSEKDHFEMDGSCDDFFDSVRLMCCCLTADDEKRSLSKGSTQDSEDSRAKLLGPLHPDDKGKKCLVLDLDETLVHSSFRAVPNADFVIPVHIEDLVHFVYVSKRPGVDEFLNEMAKHYEIVIYTASLNKYADPLLDLLDPNKVIRTRLFRESCVFYGGNYVKDLSLLDRDLATTIIIDNSPYSYMFHPENAIDCSSYIDDPKDRELDQIGAFLAGIKDVKDVRGVCDQWRDWPVTDTNEKTQAEF